MPLVEIARFSDRLEAGLARAELDALGIHAVLFDTEMSWVGGIIPIRLMALDEDRDAAPRRAARGRTAQIAGRLVRPAQLAGALPRRFTPELQGCCAAAKWHGACQSSRNSSGEGP